MKKTPFQETIFMDLDCHVKGKIDDIFYHAKNGFSVALDIINRFTKTDVAYNTGVIVYHKKNKIVDLWCKGVADNHAFYRSDQDLLERMLDLNEKLKFDILPNHYHWPRLMGKNDKAIILHYTGGEGNKEIKKMINQKTT